MGSAFLLRAQEHTAAMKPEAKLRKHISAGHPVTRHGKRVLAEPRRKNLGAVVGSAR